LNRLQTLRFRILSNRRAYVTQVLVLQLLAWVCKAGVVAVLLAAYGIPVGFHTLFSVLGGNRSRTSRRSRRAVSASTRRSTSRPRAPTPSATSCYRPSGTSRSQPCSSLWRSADREGSAWSRSPPPERRSSERRHPRERRVRIPPKGRARRARPAPLWRRRGRDRRTPR
jgi:hypothetical protein